MTTMDRRAALARMIQIAGGVAVGGQFLALTGCGTPEKPRTEAFTPDERALMDEIGETILPTTDTPGAKAAGVGATMAVLAHDCYSDASFAEFRRGLADVDERADSKHSKRFVECTPAERTALLNAIDREQREARLKKVQGARTYMTQFKQLTTIGYFTSEIGATKALRYVAVPGAYRGDEPYHKGDKGWSNPTRRIG